MEINVNFGDSFTFNNDNNDSHFSSSHTALASLLNCVLDDDLCITVHYIEDENRPDVFDILTSGPRDTVIEKIDFSQLDLRRIYADNSHRFANLIVEVTDILEDAEEHADLCYRNLLSSYLYPGTLVTAWYPDNGSYDSSYFNARQGTPSDVMKFLSDKKGVNTAVLDLPVAGIALSKGSQPAKLTDGDWVLNIYSCDE